jgi:hypothetical protein
MAASLSQASYTAGDRLEVTVPPDTIVVLGAARRSADDQSYRAVRYDRVADGVVRQTARSELRQRVELPALPGQSYLYIDSIHGNADHPTKTKLSTERLGDGVWRLNFSDNPGMFSQPDFLVTVRFRKPSFYEHGGTGGATRASHPATRPAAASAGGIVWAGPGEPVRCGDLRIRLLSAIVTQPGGAAPAASGPITAPAPAAAATLKPALHLTFAVDNASTTRKLTFRRWRGDDFPAGGDHIRDNFGNTYRLIPTDPLASASAGAGGAAVASTAALDPSVSLYPGKSATVDLAFEPPVEGVQFLEVELPAGNVGGFNCVPLRFRVPASAIRR